MARTHICTTNGRFVSSLARASIGLLTLAMLAGCTESSRCLGRSVPQFDTDALANSVLNQVYTQSIRASVSNSVEDDLFGYSFSLRGDLPAGISTRQDDRRFFFEGTPTTLGEHPLELTVRLSNDINLLNIADVADLCRDSATEAYNLSVTL